MLDRAEPGLALRPDAQYTRHPIAVDAPTRASISSARVGEAGGGATAGPPAQVHPPSSKTHAAWNLRARAASRGRVVARVNPECRATRSNPHRQRCTAAEKPLVLSGRTRERAPRSCRCGLVDSDSYVVSLGSRSTRRRDTAARAIRPGSDCPPVSFAATRHETNQILRTLFLQALNMSACSREKPSPS